jgi:PAS domain S-box-containing protein
MPDLARRVLDALPNTIYTTDLDGNITSVNRAWSRFAEASGAHEIAGESGACGRSLWSSIGDAAARAQIAEAIDDLRNGRSEAMSWEFPCDSPAEQRVFLLQIAPLRDGRNIEGFVFSTIDITPSHRSREALIEIGTALSRTIARERLFQEVSGLLRRAIPYDSFAIALADEGTGELVVAHHAGMGAPPERAELEAQWRAAREQEESDGGARIAAREPSAGVLELTAPMVRAARGASGSRSGTRVAGVMTLRTDAIDSPQRRHEAERVLATVAAQTTVAIERAELVRRVEEKRRLEAIGEVTAGIAHELRNPLFGISSAAQLLRFRAREDPVVERNVGRILREVERLNGMVTDLLEYGHPRPLQLAPGDPDEIWDDVLESNRGLLEQRSLVLHRTRASSGMRARWAIDAERIAQVFLNILVNAVDAAPVESDMALASCVLPSGAWRCALQNGGEPIPPEALPRVLELFYSTKRHGTGIGLALCDRIVKEHGGSLTIESAAGTGTTVTVTLPETPA